MPERSFVKCASVVTEPSIHEEDISPLKVPVIYDNPDTGSVDNNEGSAVCTMVLRGTYSTMSIDTSGPLSMDVVPSLAHDNDPN